MQSLDDFPLEEVVEASLEVAGTNYITRGRSKGFILEKRGESELE